MDRGTYYVTELKQLLALATAGREDIIDAVAILGPCTVPEIAKFVALDSVGPGPTFRG